MKKEEIYRHIDHTLLKADADWDSIRQLCQEALFFRMASVCIPSAYVKEAHSSFPDLNICTVIGFPMGNMNTAAKLAETRQALEDGASEFDMVINIGMVKNGRMTECEREIRAIKELIQDRVLKVIIETCYLTEEEKIALCGIVTRAGADYIKTSTGYGTAGATLEDVKLFAENIGPEVRIKAAGGIKTQEEMEAYLEAGCDRIGTSRALSALK